MGEQTRPIIDELLPHALELACDRYGNFVAQHVMQYGTEEDRKAISKVVQANVVNMSLQKFASNTVEKCLTLAPKEECHAIIAEILQGEAFSLGKALGEDDEADKLRGVKVSPLVAIMVHPFGNYVVQRMLECGSLEQQEDISSRVAEYGAGLVDGKFSKHALASLLAHSEAPAAGAAAA